jgi:hypothetical protein
VQQHTNEKIIETATAPKPTKTWYASIRTDPSMPIITEKEDSQHGNLMAKILRRVVTKRALRRLFDSNKPILRSATPCSTQTCRHLDPSQ